VSSTTWLSSAISAQLKRFTIAFTRGVCFGPFQETMIQRQLGDSTDPFLEIPAYESADMPVMSPKKLLESSINYHGGLLGGSPAGYWWDSVFFHVAVV